MPYHLDYETRSREDLTKTMIEKLPYRWQRRAALPFGLLVVAIFTPFLFVLCVFAEGVPHALEGMRLLWRETMDAARHCWSLPNQKIEKLEEMDERA